jgi:hypothetical protein
MREQDIKNFNPERAFAVSDFKSKTSDVQDRSSQFRLLSFCGIALGVLLGAGVHSAQAQQIEEADAIIGEPFGVARIVALIDPRIELTSSAITASNDRIFYPTHSTSSRPVRRLLRELIGAPRKVTAYFLFTGDEPLSLQLPGAGGTFRIRPVDDDAAHRQLLAAWWNEIASPEKREDQSKDYPTIVEDYLIGTLARRLRLPVPREFIVEQETDDLTHAVRILGGAETIRSQWMRRVALGRVDDGDASVVLPTPLSFPAVNPPIDAKTKIEPIADHVPPELFYVRFGSFPNYLWFSDRLDEWAGEVRSLVSERSVDYGLRNRQEIQLCLEKSALAEVLGPAVISDVALIGADMFQRDGAAMGILFEARNSTLLANDINADRAAALKANPTAVEQPVTVAGQKASFIHTPDNRLRSFYVVVGNYHLVTTSRHIAERFVQVSKDGKSLGRTAEYRYTRGVFGVNRHDTVFVYLSAEFLQNLVGPRYQVELQRRLHSLAEIDVLNVARVEAKSQGLEVKSIDELIRVGVLPKRFGVRPDGSRLDERDGVVVDTVRGPRGMFVPIPDVPVNRITVAEAEECLRIARKYAASWEQMTPIVAAISRSKGAKAGLEQVTLDLRLTPLAAKQYKFLASQLGAPTKQRLAPIPDDAAAFDVVLSKALGSEGGDYHLFGGLRDVDPRLVSATMLEKLIGMFGGKELKGYLGAYPRPGILWLLGATADAPVDEAGYSQFITGSWRRLVDRFTLLSFQPELLAEITPQLKFVAAERPAQAWLHATDLRDSRLAPAMNAFGYRKATELSLGNVRFLNSFTEQLHVPPDEALSIAETLLAAKLLCPLGGKYELVKSRNARPQWSSTALMSGDARTTSPPDDYEFPALYWLRGVEGEVRLTPEELSIHADIQMPEKSRKTPSFQFPSFGLPLGSGSAKPKETEEIPAPKQQTPAKETPREF